ncbi:unnamed protein product [Sphenostylis stenocarpa]|uniref:Uncharacterized protein n=1 Tax=Sphenostylis stenocarpa TaxID=92480 RepID=A0AA86VWA8_9FABA|nr:unnamed protein product [Sphenostylis stenocarpa]
MFELPKDGVVPMSIQTEASEYLVQDPLPACFLRNPARRFNGGPTVGSIRRSAPITRPANSHHPTNQSFQLSLTTDKTQPNPPAHLTLKLKHQTQYSKSRN